MSKHVMGARRTFALLSFVAMFSLVAGNSTPAYATSGNPAGWPEFSGIYVSGSATDDSGQLSPASQSSSAGALEEAILGWTASATASGSIGTIPSTSGATYNVTADGFSGFGTLGMTLTAQQGTNTSLQLTATGEAWMWDTLTFTGGLGSSVTADLVGDYTTSGNTGGSAEILSWYADPYDTSLLYSSFTEDPEGLNGIGSFDFGQLIPLALDVETVSILWEVGGSANAYNPGDGPSSFSVDPPSLQLTLPDGVTYTDASGVNYGGAFEPAGGGSAIPEPATLTLLGLGLTGLIAKVARRRNR